MKKCDICRNEDFLLKQNALLEIENAELKTQIKKYKYDSMTGLLGRSDFNEMFDNLWHEYKSFGQNFMLAIIDLNGLHQVNRELGFSAGDRFIISVASSIKELFDDCSKFRTSGDEFFILLQGKRCTDFRARLELIPDIEFCVVSTLEGYESPTDMFNTCDAKVIDKKELNKTKRED